MFLYSRKRGRVREACGAHLLPAVVEARGAESVPPGAGFVSLPRAPPQPGRARRLSTLASGLHAAVRSLQSDETRDTNGYPACGADVLDFMGAEAKAVWFSRLGMNMRQSCAKRRTKSIAHFSDHCLMLLKRQCRAIQFVKLDLNNCLLETTFTWLFVSISADCSISRAGSIEKAKEASRAARRNASTAAPQAVEQHHTSAVSLHFPASYRTSD